MEEEAVIVDKIDTRWTFGQVVAVIIAALFVYGLIVSTSQAGTPPSSPPPPDSWCQAQADTIRPSESQRLRYIERCK